MKSFQQQIKETNDKYFEQALQKLIEILKIPSLSREFDPEYLTNGLLLKTAESFRDFIIEAQLKNAKIELHTDEGYSPFLYVEVASTDDLCDKAILMYGHMDKQPPFVGWKDGLSAYDPKIIDDKLYGRGGADDGYSIILSVLALKTIQELGLKHPRVVMVFEADEESGSHHIYHYLEKLKSKIGEVGIVLAMDASCGSYDRIWTTTTLRGIVVGIVTVKVLEEGVHSGDASGVVPSSFRIFRQLLNRIDDPMTGQVVEDFQVQIPEKRYKETQKTAEVFTEVISKFPFHDQTQPVFEDRFQVYLNKVWKAQLSVTGADGLPPALTAGNVLRPETTLKLSLRLPPTKDPKEAENAFVKILTTDVPNNATVEFKFLRSGPGFMAQDNQPWFDQLINEASQFYYGNEAVTFGDGGAMYLLNYLQQQYQKAQFLVVGVLGTGANEHGPNECLDIPNVRKLINCITYIIAGSQQFMQKN